MSTSTPRACIRPRPGQAAFTLIEILLVIVIIGILAALLLPAIGSAIRKARETAVASEINAMAQALNDFKSKYGDYPPSRIVLAENGDYSGLNAGNIQSHPANPYLYTAGSDISVITLYQRSLRYMRKFFPRMNLSSSGPVWPAGSTTWYDFNGNGFTVTAPETYVITGHECLVFFLGGVPSPSQDSNGNLVYAMNGFSRNPLNPFPLGGTGSNRQPALFEFAANRLVDGDHDGIPGYQDSLNTGRAYSYFSSYGGNAYDPNDDNFPSETDTLGNTPYTLTFQVGFPTTSGNLSISPPPNPYTSSVTAPATTLNVNTPVVYQTPQTFQIISAGVDGSYGVGGSYQPNGGTALPMDPLFYNSPPGPYSSSDGSQRTLERDNVCNFHNGRLD